jgi:hypothetical protein
MERLFNTVPRGSTRGVERGHDEVGDDHVESCLLTKTELARREPERALLYRGIGAVREKPHTRTETTVNQTK